MMSSHHEFAFILYTKMKKKNHISAMRMSTCLNSSLNRWRIMLTPIYFDMRDMHILNKFGPTNSKFYVQSIWQIVRL